MTAYKKWTLADGTRKKGVYYKYRCGSFYKRGAIKCDGQTTYGTTKLEPIVIEETKHFIQSLQEKNFQEEFISSINRSLKHYENVRDDLSKRLRDCEQELTALKSEISKVLLGKSLFKQSDLLDAIEEKKQLIEKLLSELNHCNEKLNDLAVKKESSLV